MSEDLVLAPENSKDLVLSPENSKDPLLNLSVEPKPDRFSGSAPSLKQNPLFRLLNPQPDNIRYLNRIHSSDYSTLNLIILGI